MDNFCEDWFVFKENKSKQKFIEYMKFDNWLSQFEELKELLNQHYKNIKW